MKRSIPPALSEMLSNPAAWPRIRTATWAELAEALADERLNPGTREEVRRDLEAVGAVDYMRQHPDVTLGDAVLLLTSTNQ